MGVQSLNQSRNDWYGRAPAFGMGRRECKHIEPKFQVCNRPQALMLYIRPPLYCAVQEAGTEVVYELQHKHLKTEAVLRPIWSFCLQVRHRCKCSDLTICGTEVQIVERLAAEGRLVPNAKPRLESAKGP